jgi:hypothetical protein
MQHDSHITTYETRTISPAGVPGPVRTIRTLDDRTDVAARDVQVGLDSTGDAVFSWTRDGIEARTFTGGNHLGPIQKLSALGSDSALAMDPAGDAIVVWARNAKVVQARRVSTAGVVGPTKILSAPPLPGSAFEPRPAVAIAADGDAVAAWRGPNRDIFARTFSNPNVLGPIEQLSVSDPNSSAPVLPTVAIDPSGDHALVVWPPIGTGAPLEGAWGP